MSAGTVLACQCACGVSHRYVTTEEDWTLNGRRTYSPRIPNHTCACGARVLYVTCGAGSLPGRADDVDLVRACAWDAGGHWFAWVCNCGARNIVVPPDLDFDDDDAQKEPVVSFNAELLCLWCGSIGDEADALGHVDPTDLLKSEASS